MTLAKVASTKGALTTLTPHLAINYGFALSWFGFRYFVFR